MANPRDGSVLGEAMVESMREESLEHRVEVALCSPHSCQRVGEPFGYWLEREVTKGERFPMTYDGSKSD